MKILEPGAPALPPNPKAGYSSSSMVNSANADYSPGLLNGNGSETANQKPLSLKFAGSGRGAKGPTQKLRDFESLMINGVKQQDSN